MADKMYSSPESVVSKTLTNMSTKTCGKDVAINVTADSSLSEGSHVRFLT